MKLIRTPNLKRRLTDPLRPKRIIVHKGGIKMPKGGGIIRSPKKYIYNKTYNLLTKKLF
jgi:hypothetical protein